MRVKLIQLYNNLRASYWFLPSLMTLGAIMLSVFTVYLDNRLGGAWIDALNWLPANRPEGARAVLSSISGSMITVAGVTFSMTLVSVSFASAQFGPRLVGNFMRDTGNQITLGTFIATFVYCLMVLRTVRSAEQAQADAEAVAAFVPHVSILVALGFTLASVAVLIYFIHHIPETIDVSNITAKVGRELERRIKARFPSSMGSSSSRLSHQQDVPVSELRTELPPDFFERAVPVISPKCGYLDAIDESGLLQLAIDNDLIVRLQYRAGDFATRGRPLMLAYSQEPLEEKLAGKLAQTIAWSHERSPSQNVLFLVDELVEIMARALSPGVNDPFTAISCMNWLQQSLQTMATTPEPDPRRLDENGQLRVMAYPLGFDAFCCSVFDQSMPYVAADRNAALQMARMLGELITSLPDGPPRQLLLQYVAALELAGEQSLSLDMDRQTLKVRCDRIRAAVDDPDYHRLLMDRSDWLQGSA